MTISTNIGTRNSLVGHILADKYQLDEVIREDAFGTIYRGTHLLMEMPVNVKVLSPLLAVDESIVDRFSIEAKTISRLSHPNILNITDFGKDIDGSVFIVMERVEGETAKNLIEREGPFSVERAVRITRQIAGALSAAHSNGIIHSAVSSSKVLVSPIGNGQDIVKLLDIGSFSATSRPGLGAEASLDDVAYLSPEQCSQESEADERSDIYSLGIVFYELLTGEVPFMADTATDLMLKHAEVPPPPLAAFRSDIPDAVEPILLNALAKNPDKRYQSAVALAEDLSEAIKGDVEDDTIVIPKVNPGADQANANNIWKTAFIVLAGISLLAFGMIYWTNNRTTDPLSVLPVDKDSQPVQPLNPATGVNEQGNLMTLPPGTLVQGDPAFGPDVGGGDGYDPWANTPVPRGGGNPMEVPPGPGGEMYTIPGEDGSIFMPNPDGSGVILVPKYVPDETPKPEASETPKPEKSPATASPSPSKTKSPAATPAASPKPAEVKKPADAKPKDPPAKKETPAPSSKKSSLKSGTEQDT